MRIIRDLSELSVPLENTVVTIGNFDGVHLGHREIFRRVVTRAHRIGGTSVVFTFVPHPLKVLDPQRAPRLINSYAEKERLIEASCIDVLVCAPFSREFAAMSASRFVEEILVGKLGVRHMIVGYDYAFGRHREGDLPFLQRKGREFGFSVEELKPITADSTVYSSTRIRRMLMNGRVADVVDYLGRHYTVEGRVVGGERRGKKLGFPTANLETEKDLLPKPGVYAVKVRRGDSLLDGVVNIGSNPTFGAEGFSVEVHLLDFSEEIYDENLRLYFIERLRD
ncbi:MAG TPA: bifunctional riboflavin kinase/FAD synthetase, partial [Desulfuromonadales bacterium]|nr:bifunctional riboflavin kinase/FAD synthetase [Desulfuromonadales bacterium]